MTTAVVPPMAVDGDRAKPTNGEAPVGAAAPVAALFAPIAADLRKVEEIFERELVTDVGFVAEMTRHIGGFRGKMLRPALLLLVGKACGRLTRDHHVLGAVVEMVHVATLVHDDVLDESRVRRGRATANQRWGNEGAVLLGDFLISHAYHLCSGVPDTEAARLVGAATNTVCEGELLQVSHRGNWDLTEAEYYEIIARKTGCLTGLAGRLGARYAGADEATCARLERFGAELGVAFQIIDDVLDLVGDGAEVGKTLGTDLAKGKLTLPMIHLLSHCGASARAELVEWITRDPAGRLGDIRGRLAENDSLDYASAAAEGRIEAALDCLTGLSATPARDALEAVAGFVTRRRR